MRGPFWNNPKFGVTGERNFTPNYETYVGDDGVVRTRVLPREEEDVD